MSLWPKGCHLPTFRALTGIALSLSAIGFFTFYLIFQAAFTEKQNHSQVLIAILKSEMTRQTVVVGNNPKQLLTRNQGELKTYMAKKGWAEQEQLGSLTTYKSTDAAQTIAANCAMYSRLYRLCELSYPP